MFKIVARSRFARNGREIIDRVETREGAEFLRDSYQLALGNDWVVEIMASKAEQVYAQIEALSREGLTLSQIAERMGSKPGTIQHARVRLAAAGRVEKRAPGQRKNDVVERRNEQIAQLVEAHKGPKEISEIMRMKYFTVRAIVHQLRTSGRLPRVDNN